MSYRSYPRQALVMAETSSRKCVVCGSSLSGRQRSFCSLGCKNRYTNYHHQSYAKQLERARINKSRLVGMKGGKCMHCGYARNFAALEFHHRDASSKSFQLDARTLANRQWSEIEIEAAKCDLLCSNCHAETHNPEAMLDATGEPCRSATLMISNQVAGSMRSSRPFGSSVSR